MKNFKRVISAVIALALSASTLVAVSAARYSDVPDTAANAEAINILSALGVLHGYEDGTFNPDGDITRAEAVTMIVGGVNLTKEAQGAAGTSKFTDVNEQASWASGYVNVGVAQGFINGMDDTHFAPQDKVTYAQMCVMLTLITGYGDYAKEAGGWPTGYISMANQAKISEGVILEANATLKRGQVAKMVYNAVKAYKLGVVKYTASGNEYAPLNGTSSANNVYSTILTDEFDSYVVTATVTGTAKTGAANAGEAVLDITKADRWEDTEIKSTDPVVPVTVLLEGVDADAYLHQSGTAVITVDENEKKHLIYFYPTDKIDSKVVKAEDYVSPVEGGKNIGIVYSDPATKEVSFTDPGGYTAVPAENKITFERDYKVDANPAVFVNGYEYMTTLTFDEAKLCSLLEGAQGNVTLVNSDNVGNYDKILISYYDVAKVTSVLYSGGKTTIMTSPYYGINNLISSIVIDEEEVEAGKTILTVKDTEGNDVELSALKKGDIIAFAVDPSLKGKIEPDAIDIIVTDETASGKVSTKDDVDHVVSVDGQDYKLSDWSSIQKSIEIGYSYALTLDPFGRIFAVEEEASTAKFAIAEKFSDSDLLLILPNGTSKYYEAESAKWSGFPDKNGDTKLDITNDIAPYLSTNGLKPEQRVVTYSTKATGELKDVALAMSSANVKFEDFTGVDEEYNASTSKVGSVLVSDATSVVDATSRIKDNISTGYSAFSTSSFIDGNLYSGCAFKTKASTAYTFVLLTATGKDIGESSRFAVVRKTAVQSTTADGEDCWVVNALYDGQETDLIFDRSSNPAADAAKKLGQGDAFFFKKNSDGLIDDVEIIYENSKFANNSLAAFTAAGGFTKFDYTAADWDFTIENTKKDYKLVYGVVTKTSSGNIQFAYVKSNKIDLNHKVDGTGTGYYDFGVDADCVAYRYGRGDYAAASKQADAIGVTTADGIIASNLDSFETGTATDIYDLTLKSPGIDGYEFLTYAVALVVKDSVVEIYALNQQ